MFGLGDFWVSLVFVLILLSSLLCVIYGAVNWNKGGNEDAKLDTEEQQWQVEEKTIEETL